MRVPDLTSTAGYADVFDQIEKNNASGDIIKNSYLLDERNRVEDFQNVNGNFYSGNAFECMSSANTFVQKALNSSATNLKPKKIADEHIFYEAKASTENAYRSFKGTLKVKNPLCMEYGKDYVKAIEDFNECPTETNLDPIFSTKSQVRETSGCKIKNFDINVRNGANISKNKTTLKKSNCGSLMYEYGTRISHETQDYSMIDLCNENTITVNRDYYSDDYLESSSSTSISLNSSKSSYFPRGIINPNYPGFQHLAHTLSEHLFEHGTDSNDSDTEYEMELSTDSFDDTSDEAMQEHINVYKCSNNNIRKSVKFTSKLQSSDDANHNIILEENDIFDLPNNLQSNLTLLEPHNLEDECFNKEDQQEHESEWTAEKKNSILNKKEFNTPPDILMKSHGLLVETNTKKENCPDLLCGVSSNFEKNSKSDFNNDDRFKQTKHILPIQKINNSSYSCVSENATKEEISLGLTPVDIIGDFGQEVEREFGLLVSGYRKLTENDRKNDIILKESEKVVDAVLSQINDHIDSDKFLVAFNQCKTDKICVETKHLNKVNSNTVPSTSVDYIDDNNAVDWLNHFEKHDFKTSTYNKLAKNADYSRVNLNKQKPTYRKPSPDERQLPPVAIDYKISHQNLRFSRLQQNSPKNIRQTKALRNNIKTQKVTNRLVNTKSTNNNNKKCKEDAEMHEFHELISNKEFILSNSRYAKMSSWAQYLTDSVDNRGSQNASDLISPSALNLFDAYKYGTETDIDTLELHFKMAKEIEKKRRNEREEIRRRLAIGAEEQIYGSNENSLVKPIKMLGFYKDQNFSTETISDTESHSSDSETCPKLSKVRQQNPLAVFGLLTANQTDFSSGHNTSHLLNVGLNNNMQDQSAQNLLLPICNEDKECNFFTKQAKLQIEARMALAQAKEMAHMQMEIERQNQRISPITLLIRCSLEKVGVIMASDKRRVSRQMLTEMNIAQLQILVNNLHTHIEQLNESLVNFLMERDDLHIKQDTLLSDIEELSRYIGEKENIAQQNKITTKNKRPKKMNT